MDSRPCQGVQQTDSGELSRERVRESSVHE